MQDQVDRMFAMFSQGESLRTIANRYNMSYSTVRRRIMNEEGYEYHARRNAEINRARAMQASNNPETRGRGNEIMARHIVSKSGIDRILLNIQPKVGSKVTPETIRKAAKYQARTDRQKSQEVYNIVASMERYVRQYMRAHNIEMSENNLVKAYSALDEYFRSYVMHDYAVISEILADVEFE